jgi:hypothetical protein
MRRLVIAMCALLLITGCSGESGRQETGTTYFEDDTIRVKEVPVNPRHLDPDTVIVEEGNR